VSRWAVSHRRADLEEVLAEPSVKLALLDLDVPSEALLELARELAVPGAGPTTSGAPFLEVGKEGISKATALARFAHDRGYSADEVVAFGDNNNDVEMLAWAGHSVAMANAVPAAMEVSDEVTATNDEDGVAQVIERLLG
jgi:hydroxymethylpyrimidine pyrophosphatase-like HAD family hydrolase